MDHSLPLSSYSVIQSKEGNKSLEDKISKSCVTVCGEPCRRNNGTSLNDMRHNGYERSNLCGDIAPDDNSDMCSDNIMVDKLFEACDPLGKGTVRVSSLVEYLTAIVDVNLQESGAVASLKAELDPKSIDAEIDNETFCNGLHHWIEQMQSGHMMGTSVLSSHEDSAAIDSSQKDGIESLLEESTVEDKLSISQLANQLTDFQYINRKLSEEIHESQCIIDSKEEELLKLTRELENARSQIKRLQELADFRHEAEAENELLREQMTFLTENLNAERHKTKQTEQEKELLKTQLHRYQSQVVKISTDHDILKHQQEDLKSLLTENKEKIFQLKAVCSGLDAQLAEKDEHIQELQACLREVSRMNADLKNQNQDLQGQRSEAQQELLSLKSVLDDTGSGIRFLPVQGLVCEVEGDLDQPHTQNVQNWSGSIHNELQDLTEEEVTNSGMSDLQLVERADIEDNPQKKNKCSCDIHYDISNEKLRFIVSLLKHFREENQRLHLFARQSVQGNQALIDSVQCDSKRSTSTNLTQPSFIKKNERFFVRRRYQSESDTAVKKLQNYIEKLLLDAANLKRSNEELAEKLHSSECKSTDEVHACTLDGEVQNIRSCLDREKQHCAELEESLCNNTLARQLDLKDIWRLVQKDVEDEYQDLQEDCLSGCTAEEIKQKIKRDIEALRNKHDKRETSVGSLKKSNLNIPLALHYGKLHKTYILDRHKFRLSSSSYLIDALAIDVFNENLPMYHPTYPYPPTAVSCEDVDCYECRAARLMIQSKYSTSCPSFVPTNVNSHMHLGEELNNDRVYNQVNSEGDHSETRIINLDMTADASICVQNSLKGKRSLYGSYRRKDFIRNSGRGVKDQSPQHCTQSQQSESTVAAQNNCQITAEECSFPVPGKDELNFSFHDTPFSSYLLVTDDLQPNIRFRRSSFISAVECSQEEFELSSENTQPDHTKKDSSPSTEDLRRPSFHAAIELGKDVFSVSHPSIKRKIVQIASPEISKSREVTDKEITHEDDNNDIITPNMELTELMNFQPDVADSSIYGGVITGAQNLEPTTHRSNINSMTAAVLSSSSHSPSPLSSSRSSPWTSASAHPLLSSCSFPRDHCHSLESRYSPQKKQAHTLVPKEQTRDISDGGVVKPLDDSSADMSQQSRNTEDSIKGRNIIDGLVQCTLQATKAEGRPLISSNTAKSVPPSRHGTMVTSSPMSPSSSSVLPSPQSHLIKVSARPADNKTSIDVEARASTQVGVDKSEAVAQKSGDTNARKVQTTSRENHLTIRKREQMKARSMKLPELTESSESETAVQLSTPPITNISVSLAQGNAMMAVPQIAVTDEDAVVPPAASDDIVTPSLPDLFLKKLGLSANELSSGDSGNEISIDQLQEREIENKFLSLALAFKTDKLTLDQRASIQQRARDLAEQNVELELQGLRKTVEALSELVTDAQLRGVLQKIKQHICVLEKSSARVSSRAEVYGAVQQERRLCKAMEVMVHYTENVRRIREKEESELHEARKLLNERSRNGLNVDIDSNPSRRSMSVCGYSAVGRTLSSKPVQQNFTNNTVNDAGDYIHSADFQMRRRSEAVLPKIIGGVGSPSLTPSAALDPKLRFQAAVASTSIQNVVTTAMRPCSLEKQHFVSSAYLSPPLYFGISSPPPLSTNKLAAGSVSDIREEKAEVRISQDEEAFRKGFEEGLKTKLCHELNELRDQQNSISHNLEQVMDKVDQSQMEDEAYYSRPSWLGKTLVLVARAGAYILRFNWRSNRKIIRNLTGVFFVLLAVFIVFFSPPVSTVDVRHVTKPPQ